MVAPMTDQTALCLTGCAAFLAGTGLYFTSPDPSLGYVVGLLAAMVGVAALLRSTEARP